MEKLQKLKTFYKVEITMNQDAYIDDDSAVQLSKSIFRIPNGHEDVAMLAVDNVDDHFIRLSFRSALGIDDVIDNSTLQFISCPDIEEIMIEYQLPYDIEPGKVILRFNQEPEFFIGKITWTKEDK